MEPRVAELNTNKAPIAVWGEDSPSTPPPEYYKTAQTSPVILQKDESKESLNTYPASSPKSITSNNNGSVIPYNDGVKFIDSTGNVFTIDKDDSICSSGSSGDDDESDEKSKVPDGGWGWVVVACSLVISMIADGISFSFGLVYIEFLDAFGQSKAKTAWIGSLFMAVPLLSGPVMSAFVDRYGCRSMTIAGGIISGIGFVLAVFGNSVEYEYMTFGVIAGLGLGLCYVTAVVSVCQWFEKKRAFATGLGACGTGFGTTVYAPMTQYFIREYGWRGTVLLLAGTFFNMCVCGALIRDPEYLTKQRKEKYASSVGTKSVRNPSSCGDSVSGIESTFPGSDEIRSMMKSGKKPEEILSTLAESFKFADEVTKRDPNDAPRPCHSLVDLPTHVRGSVPLENIMEDPGGLLSCKSASDKGKLNQVDSPERNRALSIRRQKKKMSIAANENPQAAHMQPLLTSSGPPAVIVNGLDRPKPRMSIFKRQFSFKDSPQNYLQNIRVHRNSMMFRAATLTTGRYHLRASSCPNIFRNSMTTLAKEEEEKWYSALLEFGKAIFDFSMWLEFHFLLLSIAIILLFTFFITPIFYLAEMMTRNGYTAEDGSQILGNIGVVTGFGMIFFGWIGDQPWTHVPKLFASCMVCCGISCIFMPFVVQEYWILCPTVWTFGLFFSSSYSLTPPIITELIPIERFSTAYGLILLCQGIGNLIGPPIAGAIFDALDSWDYAFYCAGVGIILCGLFIGLIPFTKNRLIYGTGMLEMDRISVA